MGVFLANILGVGPWDVFGGSLSPLAYLTYRFRGRLLGYAAPILLNAFLVSYIYATFQRPILLAPCPQYRTGAKHRHPWFGSSPPALRTEESRKVSIAHNLARPGPGRLLEQQSPSTVYRILPQQDD